MDIQSSLYQHMVGSLKKKKNLVIINANVTENC